MDTAPPPAPAQATEQTPPSSTLQEGVAHPGPPEANGSATEHDQQHAAVQESVPAPVHPLLAPYEEQWRKVSETPNDFMAWTALLQTAEKLDDLQRLRAVYEPFLASYPLCYGYWKKYADVEHRHGSPEAALAVYERGVSATPYSMDLWAHYAAYKRSNGGTADDVRAVFERAVAYNGTDYTAHQLWDKYLAFEEDLGSPPHIAALYARAAASPLRDQPRYIASLRSYIAPRAAAEFILPDDMAALGDAVRLQKEQAATAAALDAPDSAAAAVTSADTSFSDEDIKAAWLAQREAAADLARRSAEARRPFEEGIKRPYFHVKPLDAPQLLNWVRYLDYVEAGGDLAAAVIAYERCLVPCASYPELWERYVRWLAGKGMEAEADGALQRAVNVFCRTRPEIFLFAAQREEQAGRTEAARAHLDQVLMKLAPGLLQAVAAAANFERRQGSLDAACGRWEAALEVARGKLAGAGKGAEPPAPGARDTQEGETTPDAFAFASMHYATFLHEVCRKPEKAREVLKQALGVAPGMRHLWEAAIHLELSVGGEGVFERVAPLFECATAKPGPGATGLPEQDREELTRRFAEVADALGDVKAAASAAAVVSARYTLPPSITATAAAEASRLKRGPEAGPGGEPWSKAYRMDGGAGVTDPAAAAAAAAAAYGAYPAAAAGAAAGVAAAPGAVAAYPSTAAPAAAAVAYAGGQQAYGAWGGAQYAGGAAGQWGGGAYGYSGY